jgi:preprotein translocase subunit SecG
VGRKTNKQQRQKQALTAREKAAANRAVQQRAEQRSRAVKVLSSVLVLVVVAVVIVVVVITRPTKSDPSGNRVNASATILSQAGSVSDATFNTVGAGKVLTPPTKVSGLPALTSGGKPEVLYIGAEFCPYCAIERWALYESLSRFGSFSNVGEVRSATDDGNYASLDFYKSSYTSKYLTFTSVENEDRSHNILQKTTTAQNKLWSTISKGSEGFPFIDFGNKYAIAGNAPLDPSVLGTMNQSQIAAQLNNPKSKVAQEIDGGANDITAAICSLTNNQPSTVCSSSVVKSLQTTING